MNFTSAIPSRAPNAVGGACQSGRYSDSFGQAHHSIINRQSKIEDPAAPSNPQSAFPTPQSG